MEVHPHIEKFVDAEAGQEVGLEALRLEIFLLDVIVAFKGRNAPTDGPLGQKLAAFPVGDVHMFVGHDLDSC
jgi:hypothetical protein